MTRARLLMATAFLAMSNTLPAQIVTNGGFETFTGTFAPDGGAALPLGNTQLTGWTVVGGEIAVLRAANNYGLAPHGGTNFLDLAGYGDAGFPKGLSQSLSGLTVGGSYTFSMWLGVLNGNCSGIGVNRCSGPVSARATIGSSSQTFTHNSLTAGNQWGSYGFNFVASSTTMFWLTVEGMSLPVSNAYIGLDDVSVVGATTPPVSAVPEPSTYALMAVGLAVVGMLSHRRRRVTA